MRILIMGLSGSGKTSLATALAKQIDQTHKVAYINGDELRTITRNNDFTMNGRLAQAAAMRQRADECDMAGADFVICDFICPTAACRQAFGPTDLTIWLDTVDSSCYPDTDAMFEPPLDADLVITDRLAQYWAANICATVELRKQYVIHKWTPEAPTAQLMGRFQPWHDGHQALFLQSLNAVGQVAIMVRQCERSARNPMTFRQVSRRIHAALAPRYWGYYRVIAVPNITNVVYGRDVGYKLTQISLPPSLEAISATAIRKAEGLDCK